MLTGYPLSCTLGRSVLGIGSGVARFLMIAEYATYRYLRCVVNVGIISWSRFGIPPERLSLIAEDRDAWRLPLEQLPPHLSKDERI